MESKTCPWCGDPIQQRPGRGRPPVYCSTRCRRYAYEQRRAAEREGQPVRVVVKQSPPHVIERTRQAWSRPDPNALAEALEEYPDLAAPVLRRMVELAVNDRLSERARTALGTYLVRFTGELFRARFAFSQRPATSATRVVTAEQWGYLAVATDRITAAERALDLRTRALDQREERLQQRQTELDRRAEDIAQRYEQAGEHEEQARRIRHRLNDFETQARRQQTAGPGGSFYRATP
ncbi:hypothetical protein [Kocuria arenosa]|uniref:hypothetical protein n=1 Tax=Kocuria arenosa TaxID=3071446 RepID=UPI0034D47A0F